MCEGIKGRDKERKRASLAPRCARARSSAAWEISFMRCRERKSEEGGEREAGTHSIQLFSIKNRSWPPLECVSVPGGAAGVFDAPGRGNNTRLFVFYCESCSLLCGKRQRDERR